MNTRNSKDVKAVGFIYEAYKSNKGVLELASKSFTCYPETRIKLAEEIVYRIEFAIQQLEEHYYLILKSDIIDGNFGTKRRSVISDSFYYHYRLDAYKAFLRELEK